MSNKNVFQLSVLSQNDAGAADGADIYCKITQISNGDLRSGSFPINQNVELPIPPAPNTVAPPTPTWFLIPTNDDTASFSVEVFCPTDEDYPTASIVVTESEVRAMVQVPFAKRENLIYQKGVYGIIGFATEGPNGLIYTITAGVLNPRLHGNG